MCNTDKRGIPINELLLIINKVFSLFLSNLIDNSRSIKPSKKHSKNNIGKRYEDSSISSVKIVSIVNINTKSRE
ncbi:MAG: hypothetical protein PHP08_04105 [Candidatus Dojkabacteria bacterium]|nr:hypothetical protein [Candidatus Dojkabacteria bacterium]